MPKAVLDITSIVKAPQHLEKVHEGRPVLHEGRPVLHEGRPVLRDLVVRSFCRYFCIHSNMTSGYLNYRYVESMVPCSSEYEHGANDPKFCDPSGLTVPAARIQSVDKSTHTVFCE